MTFRPTSVLAACLLLAAPLAAQTEVQVVTQVIEKTWPYREGNELNIEGDKAKIVVDTWTEPTVRVVLELVAKHPDRTVAERDLAYMVHSAKLEGENIYLRNYLKTPDGSKRTEAALSAVYTVTLPDDCPVYLKNNFGNTFVSNLARSLQINSEFSKVEMQNLSGAVAVNSRFGTLDGAQLDGDVRITGHRTDITLRDIRGNFDIRSKFGTIKLFTDPDLLLNELLTLDIEAEKSDVYFFSAEPTAFGYDLIAHYGTITAPQDLKMNFLENTESLKRAVFSPAGGNASVSVKITFGDVVIRKP